MVIKMNEINDKASSFEKIIIIGYGKATGEILKFVDDKKNDFGYELEFIEHEIHPFSITLKICEERGIPNKQIEDKNELIAYFDEKASENHKLLILSASNNFLFPKCLVEKDNVTIVNFHNALLPKFPGRNAPSWVIYEGEKETGITWHYVTSGVDEGSIIIQKKCDISPDMRAFELTEKLMDLAYEGFCEVFERILFENIEAKPQDKGFISSRKMYKSKEVPGDACFNLNDKVEDIYRLFRALDYGKNDIFPEITSVVNGEKVKFIRYKKISKDKVDLQDGLLYLPFEDGDVLKLKYKTVL